MSELELKSYQLTKLTLKKKKKSNNIINFLSFFHYLSLLKEFIINVITQEDSANNILN